jgi:hypothetical protein
MAQLWSVTNGKTRAVKTFKFFPIAFYRGEPRLGSWGNVGLACGVFHCRRRLHSDMKASRQRKIDSKESPYEKVMHFGGGSGVDARPRVR